MGIAQSTGLEYDSTKWEKVNSNVLYDTLRNKQTG